MIPKKLLNALLVQPGTKSKLAQRSSDWDFDKGLRKAGKTLVKKRSEDVLAQSLLDLTRTQNVLYASAKNSVLVVLQAMDCAGKDGTIKHVMSGVNPQGCRVHSFKQPSTEEKAHDFLWRYSYRLPERGMIGIFNRSHYEDVLVVRVNPDLLGPQTAAAKRDGKEFWQRRFDAINSFERLLVDNGTVVLKFFLHMSKSEQRKRLLARLNDEDKRWKFSPNDVTQRLLWDEYQRAYDKALTATSTPWAPWYVVPADQKWFARAMVASVLSRSIDDLDLHFPTVPPDLEKAFKAARRKLMREGEGQGRKSGGKRDR